MHSFQLWTTLALLFRLSFFFIVLGVSQTSHALTDTSQVSPSATKISQTTSVYGDSMVMTSDGKINLLKSTPEPAPWSSTSLFTLSLSLSTPSIEAQSWLTSSSSSLTSSMSSTSSTSSSSAAVANSSSTSSSSTSSLLSSSLSTSISSSSTSSSAEAAAAASSSSTSSSSTSFLLSLSTTPSIEAQSWLTSSSSSSSSLTSSMSSTSSTSSSSAAAANSSSTSSSSTSFLLSLSTPTPTPSSSTSSSSTLPLPTSFKPPLGLVTTVSPSSQKSSPALPTKSTAATSSASSTSLSSSQSFQTSSSSPQSTSSFSSPLRLSSSVQAPSLSPSKSSSSSTTLTSPSASSSSSSSSSFSRHLESSTQTLPSTQPSTEKPSDQEFAGTAVLKFDWFEELSNTSSNGYKNFSRELTAHLTDILRNSAYGSDFVRVEVYNFRNGSVIFDFKIYLKSTTVATEDFLIRVMKKGVAGSKFIITQVDVSQTFSRTSPTGKPSEETQSGLETWLIVLIACGAVIILLLLTLLFLGTQNRRLRKELSSPSILHQDDSLFIQAQVFSHEMYKMSPTPSDSCHNDSHGFKTFSPENGDDKGAVNESYVDDGGKGSDHEDEKESAAENTFI